MENTSPASSNTKKLNSILKIVSMQQVEERSLSPKFGLKKGRNIFVNGHKMNDYFKRPVHQIIVTRPLEISEENKLRCKMFS